MWLFSLFKKPKKEEKEEVVKQELLPEAEWKVILTDTHLQVVSPKGEREEVALNELSSVAVLTNDLGPFFTDVWWGLEFNEKKLMIPQGATGETELLEYLQKLEGFDNEALIHAMVSCENAVFICWERKKAG